MTLLFQRIDPTRSHRLRLIPRLAIVIKRLQLLFFSAPHHRCFVFYSTAKFSALGCSVLIRYRANQP